VNRYDKVHATISKLGLSKYRLHCNHKCDSLVALSQRGTGHPRTVPLSSSTGETAVVVAQSKNYKMAGYLKK